VSRPLFVDISDTAKSQVLAAEEWWRLNRPKAPNAIREELERAASLISVQPDLSARALETWRLPAFGDCISRAFVTMSTTTWSQTPTGSRFWGSGTIVAKADRS
jgi:hypothetical protein